MSKSVSIRHYLLKTLSRWLSHLLKNQHNSTISAHFVQLTVDSSQHEKPKQKIARLAHNWERKMWKVGFFLFHFAFSQWLYLSGEQRQPQQIPITVPVKQRTLHLMSTKENIFTKLVCTITGCFLVPVKSELKSCSSFIIRAEQIKYCFSLI